MNEHNIRFATKPTDFLFVGDDGEELVRFTADRRVIVPADIYAAAEGFWKILTELAPEGWFVEQDKE